MKLMIDKVTLIEKYIWPFMVFLTTMMLPVFYWFGAIGFFMMADLIIRLFLCKKNEIPIESEKMWRTVYKFGVGCTFILVAYMCQKVFVPDIPMMKIMGSFLILVELKSLDEKAKEITGYSVFGIIIAKLTPPKE